MGDLCADCYWEEHDKLKRPAREARHKWALENIVKEAFETPVGNLAVMREANPHVTPKMIMEKMWADYHYSAMDAFMALPSGASRLPAICAAFGKVL